MSRYAPGTRVFAVLSATETVIDYLGEGVYEGDQPCPYLFENPNPKIVLDTGETVWGMQCWWGPLERWDEFAKGRAVRHVAPKSVPPSEPS